MAMLVLLAGPVLAGTIAHPAPRDPLLDGGDSPACAAQADYAAGTDATGHPIVPADVENRPVPVPDEIAMPLHGQASAFMGRQTRSQAAQPGAEGPFVSLDGRKLAPLLNPKPCR